MKILMDADCLIKLTKAGLKEKVVSHFKVFIPEIVEQEVVVDGKEHNCPDALVVEKNIQSKAIKVVGHGKNLRHGDEAILTIFENGQYDVVATDDAKLLKRLKANHISFILPAVILYRLFLKSLISKIEALNFLEQLAEYISDDEVATIRLLMEEVK